MRLPRFMQILIGGMFGLLSVVLLGVAIAQWSAAPLVGSAIFAVVGAIAVSMFQLQLRGMAAKGRRIAATIREIAQRVFDAPAEVRPGYDMTVTGNPFGALESDEGAAFTTDGRVGDVKVSIASHASTMGRQLGEMSHVYSYVCVDVLGLVKKLHLTKEGAATKIARAAGLAEDAEVGDASFDGAWRIDADPDLARDVLDDSVRARLMDLRSKVPLVSQDFGPGTMSVILTQHGLALRWPGEIDVPLATFMRDLLLDMRKNILAHEDRRAARAGAAQGGGYRIAADEPLEEQEAEAEEKELRAR